MISTSKIRTQLTEMFRDCEPILLADLVADTVPTHIVGPTVFVLSRRGARPLVAKIADPKRVSTERTSLEEVGRRVAVGKETLSNAGIDVPIVHGVDKLPRLDLAVLVTSFQGLHTLESYRLRRNSAAIERGLVKTCECLAKLDVVWPAVMARNVVLGEGRSSLLRLSPVDWELGFLELASVRQNDSFLPRCIDLLEELGSFSRRLLAYWLNTWPSPDEVCRWTGAGGLHASVDISDRHGSRLKWLAANLQLPHSLTDGQYFRLVQVLCALCEQHPVLASVLFAADQLSYLGGLELRMKCTLLGWYLNASHRSDFYAQLHAIVKEAGHQAYLCWRDYETDDLLADRAAAILAELEAKVESLGSFTISPHWQATVTDVCREYILNPSSRYLTNEDGFRVLYMI